ncbi:hypothetical protein SLT36_20500 [Aminobacter sp. BA135]|uniref:hypothetical protein n=1 Tax=Aminobacter sp. BA135 TaxID=537596 RepID=UPI003D79C668
MAASRSRWPPSGARAAVVAFALPRLDAARASAMTTSPTKPACGWSRSRSTVIAIRLDDGGLWMFDLGDKAGGLPAGD